MTLKSGGGENCTPVPRRIHGGFYARSQRFGVSRCGTPVDRLSSVAIPEHFLAYGVLSMTVRDSELLTGFQATPTAPISQGRFYLSSQCEIILGN